MRSISFDLDGVLVDSRPLVRRAYAQAGVSLSDGAWDAVWGKSWLEWLPEAVGGIFTAREVHESKNRAYGRIIRDADLELTSACLLASELQSTDGFSVITSASEFAANVVLTRLNLNPRTLDAGLSAEEKIAFIDRHLPVHIDDDLTIIQCIRDGIHYVGQPLDELRKQVKELCPWMP